MIDKIVIYIPNPFNKIGTISAEIINIELSISQCTFVFCERGKAFEHKIVLSIPTMTNAFKLYKEQNL